MKSLKTNRTIQDSRHGMPAYLNYNRWLSAKAKLLSALFLLLLSLNSCVIEKDDTDEPIVPASYSQADMLGTWQRHSLVTSALNGYWIHGTMVNTEKSSSLSVVLSNGSVWDTISAAGDLLVAEDGTITRASDPVANAYMHADKKLMVGTTRRGPQYTMTFDSKAMPGTTYSSADLQGRWHSHCLIAGGEWTGWIRAVTEMDNSGKAVFMDLVNSDGDVSNDTGAQTVITSDGFLSMVGVPTYHGFLSADKKLMMVNMTDSGGGGSLMVALKEKTGTLYSKADLTGKWAVHVLVAGTANRTEHGMMIINELGIGVLSMMVRDDGSPFNNPGEINLEITDTGVITFDGDFKGFLNTDKNLIIGTMNDGTGVYNLLAMQRMP